MHGGNNQSQTTLVTLPWPPSINHYYRRVGHRTLISREGRHYRKKVASLLASTRRQPMSGRLIVRVRLHPPDRRRRDIDNLAKSLIDAMQHAGMFVDDSQIDDLHIWRSSIVCNGSVVVEIEEIGGHQPKEMP